MLTYDISPLNSNKKILFATRTPHNVAEIKEVIAAKFKSKESYAITNEAKTMEVGSEVPSGGGSTFLEKIRGSRAKLKMIAPAPNMKSCQIIVIY